MRGQRRQRSFTGLAEIQRRNRSRTGSCGNEPFGSRPDGLFFSADRKRHSDAYTLKRAAFTKVAALDAVQHYLPPIALALWLRLDADRPALRRPRQPGTRFANMRQLLAGIRTVRAKPGW